MDAPTTRLRLRVAPGARRPAIVGRHGDGWKVRVAAAPERGQANEAVLDLLAGALSLRRRDITLVSGVAARDKIVELTGIGPDETDRRLARAGGKENRMSIDTERFRYDLEQRRERVVAVLEHRERPESLEDEVGELVSSSADNHLADTATETYDRELDEGLEEDAERLLGEIDAALARIAAGTYGRCVDCGREIAEERLEAVPFTTLCIDDKRKRER